MNASQKRKISKYLSYLLRHEPENLDISSEGFVHLEELHKKLKNKWNQLTKEDIKEIVSSDEKGRYEIKKNKIRALYGHSIDVTLDLETNIDKETLYHGTTPKASEKILNEGIKPMNRKFVHLSPNQKEAKKVAKRRSEKPVILAVEAKKAIRDNIKIMKASNKVYVSEKIPPKYLKKPK